MAESAAILEIPIDHDGASVTLRTYLLDLLATLWREGEDFSSKRPFGNSGWQYDVYIALVRSGHVPGSVDEDGYVDEVDERAADELIMAALA